MKKELRQRLDTILKHDVADTLSPERYGALALEEPYQKQVHEMNAILRYFAELPEELITEHMERQLNGPAASLVGLFENLRKFNLVEGRDPKERVGQLRQAITSDYATIFDNLAPVKLMLDVDRLRPALDEFHGAVAGAKKEVAGVKKAKAQYEELHQKTLALEEKNQELLKRIGVEHFATGFHDQAKEHADAAKWWLIAAVVLGVASVCGIVGMTLWSMDKYKEATTPQVVNLTTSKLILFLVLVGPSSGRQDSTP